MTNIWSKTRRELHVDLMRLRYLNAHHPNMEGQCTTSLAHAADKELRYEILSTMNAAALHFHNFVCDER